MAKNGHFFVVFQPNSSQNESHFEGLFFKELRASPIARQLQGKIVKS